MFRKHILFALLSCVCISVAAQSNQQEKKLEKAYDLLRQHKTDDAEKYVDKLLDDSPEFGAAWDLLATIKYDQYETSKASADIFRNVSITTEGKDGKPVAAGADSLAQQLMAMLSEIDPSKTAYSEFIYTMRKATLFSRDALRSSMMLRTLNLDVEVDSNINRKALKHYDEAEKEFNSRNYKTAALLYKRAIEAQPDFYKARLYLGDCYYMTENYTDAVTVFKEAVQKYPSMLEPRKYLIDAYAKMKLYDKALEEAISAMSVYPDLSLMIKLDDAAYLSSRKISVNGIHRSVFPNAISDTSKKDINAYDKELPATGAWKFYTAAQKKIAGYCNNKGLITRRNELTTAGYLEVYSWEEMLKNSTDPALAEAREMQRLGYLDCYVLISNFHYDLYSQYVDFVKKNKEKIAKYFALIIKPA